MFYKLLALLSLVCMTQCCLPENGNVNIIGPKTNNKANTSASKQHSNKNIWFSYPTKILMCCLVKCSHINTATTLGFMKNKKQCIKSLFLSGLSCQSNRNAPHSLRSVLLQEFCEKESGLRMDYTKPAGKVLKKTQGKIPTTKSNFLLGSAKKINVLFR